MHPYGFVKPMPGENITFVNLKINIFRTFVIYIGFMFDAAVI